MGTIVFWIVIAVLVLVIVFSTWRNNRINAENAKQSFKDSYGQVSERHNSEEDIRRISCLFEHDRASDNTSFFVDDITFSDLELGELFDRMDSTQSAAGQEVLYSKLRTICKDSADAVSFRKIGDTLTDDKDKLSDIQFALSKAGMFRNVGAFDVINKLFGVESIRIASYIIVDVLLVLSVFVILADAGIGVVAFLVMLGIAIGKHFNGKATMDDNLQAFHFLLRLIESSRSIIGYADNNLAIIQEIDSDSRELLPLARNTFWFPKGSMSTSNPLDLLLDYVRMIFSFDIIVFAFKIRGVQAHNERVLRLYRNFGTVDAAIAAKSFSESLECIAVNTGIAENTVPMLEGIYHPFIDNPVTNSISFSKDILVTGSNASGKSTFLKAIGVSTIMYQTIGFACAAKFSVGYMRVFSSMALRDNLLGNESYYMVEARSLKRICDATDDKEPLLCIVDEVLRGTNTTERIAASTSILRYLAKKNNVFVIAATHDHELTELLKDDYTNVYFSEMVDAKGVTFTYKLNMGTGSMNNAIRLLAMMQYDESITDAATNMAQGYATNGKWE